MKFFRSLFRKLSGSQHKSQRYYSAARADRLTADILSTNLVADEVLRWQLPKLISISRNLAANNDYMKNFLRKLKVNVVGANGIGMQSKSRLKSGEIDKYANRKIEAAWAEWTKKRNTSVCASLGLRDILNVVIESAARDGEVLIRKVKGYDNRFAFALQVLEAEHLDISYNEVLSNGNKVVMGIEKDAWGKPVAYYIFERHPRDNNTLTNKRLRIPASDIIHLFVKERPSQSRGVPWAHTALIRLRMLGAYEEAALVNARVGASKMQSIIMGEGMEFTSDDTDAYGNIIMEVEPGMREILPHGTQVHDSNPAYPDGEHGIFTKAMLRGIASGIGCSYNSLANDLEGVNFSSLRSGLLEERDGWKLIQGWFIENCLDEIYPDWLEFAILSGNVTESMLNFDRLNAAHWQGRRWEWVDPEKDINARLTELNAGLTTRTRICAEKGDDFEEILEELAEEKRMIESAGLDFSQEKVIEKVIEKPDKAENPDKDDKEGRALQRLQAKIDELQREIRAALLINKDNGKKAQDVNINMELKQEKPTKKRKILNYVDIEGNPKKAEIIEEVIEHAN